MKSFQWDDPDDEEGNVAPIARHNVTPDEAEQVLRSARFVRDRSNHSTYPITFGSTNDGR